MKLPGQACFFVTIPNAFRHALTCGEIIIHSASTRAQDKPLELWQGEKNSYQLNSSGQAITVNLQLILGVASECIRGSEAAFG
jgi:hypothetical protein